jgi:hypothetical protein
MPDRAVQCPICKYHFGDEFGLDPYSFARAAILWCNCERSRRPRQLDAEAHGDQFGRIEWIIVEGSQIKRLNLPSRRLGQTAG